MFNIKKQLVLLSALITVLVTRIFLWLVWDTSIMYAPKIDTWHHAYTGIIIFIISFFLIKKAWRLKQIIRGVGAGLVIDEIILIPCMLGIIDPVDYWSYVSWGATLFALGIYARCVDRIMYVRIKRKQ